MTRYLLTHDLLAQGMDCYVELYCQLCDREIAFFRARGHVRTRLRYVIANMEVELRDLEHAIVATCMALWSLPQNGEVTS